MFKLREVDITLEQQDQNLNYKFGFSVITKLREIFNIKRVKNYPLYMVIPAVLILLLLTIYPFIYLVYVSSHIWPISPTLPRIFLGFGQFTYLFQNPDFIESLQVTVNLMVVGVTLQISLGTLFLTFWSVVWSD